MIASCSTTDPLPPPDCSSVADTTQPATVSFKDEIAPLLSSYDCLNSGCHGAPLVSSDFAVNTYEDLFNPGTEARSLGICSIKPGDPESSYLYRKITGSQIIGERMPEDAQPMSPADIETFRVWILEGARDN